jgi:hypothetical protein
MPTPRERDETFEVLDGHLIRRVVPVRGKPYQHRCRRKTYEQIAHAADEIGEAGFTLDDLVEQEGTPFSQTAVALAFLKERSCVVTRYRRTYPASDVLFEDAMTEFCALAEEG